MVNFIEELVVGSTPAGRLTVQERNLLSVVCKNMISSLLAAWRIVSSIEQKEVSRKNEDLVVLVKDYRSKKVLNEREGEARRDLDGDDYTPFIVWNVALQHTNL
ncbi:14-3-3-like protein G-BOX factor 14 kappa [Sarracenia purpurea var. burkii]